MVLLEPSIFLLTFTAPSWFPVLATEREAKGGGAGFPATSTRRLSLSLASKPPRMPHTRPTPRHSSRSRGAARKTEGRKGVGLCLSEKLLCC